jgi:hypothetical protein
MYIMYISAYDVLNLLWLERPDCRKQAMLNPTSPRVFHLPKEAGARFAGLKF